jgi:hypothetical protein
VITTALTSGTQYFIVVWQFGTTPPVAGDTAVQLLVSQSLAPANDVCSSPTTLTLNTPATGTNQGAFDDYQLSGSACFTGVGQTASTAAGRDVTYSFTAPTAGNYSIRVTKFSTTSNLVLYAASSCPSGSPPVIVSTCLAAANRNSAFGAEEVMCLSLTASQEIFLFVDENATTSGSTFTIEVTRCIAETESNNTPGTANTFVFGGEGSITPAADVDFYALGSPSSGSRVFALLEGIAGNSSDFDLRVTTDTDTLEYDDANADPAFGSLSPTVAGTPTTGAATYLRVSHFSAASVAEPYRLYAVTQPDIGSATAETEPNDTTGQCDSASNNYFSGSLSGPAPSTDVDFYCFTATAGEMILLSLDADPLRDATPINAALDLLDSGGSTLVSVNDGGSTSSTTPGTGNLAATTPFSPAESLVFRATTTGTYYAKVYIGTTSTSSTGAGDYLLSISKHGSPTAVKLANYDSRERVSVVQYDNGVLLQWRTGLEVSNLGFNIYRDQGGKRTRINSQLIAGSALTAGGSATLSSGRSYAWADTGLVNAGAAYWLEDVDLSGHSTWHGPFTITKSLVGERLSPSEQRQAALLTQLGMHQSRLSAGAGSRPAERAAATIARGQNSLAAGPAAKLFIKQEALYRVTQPELVAAGLPSKVDPALLQLYVDGQEIPIKVIGEDGSFDPADAIEFYGTGLDAAWSDTRTYWVVVGSRPGLRIPVVQIKGGTPGPRSFPFTVERRDRVIYFSSLRNGDRENFFGPVISSEAVNQSLYIRNLDPSSVEPAALEITAQGVTAVAHRIKVMLNGAAVADLAFSGQALGVTRVSIPQSRLREGENVVTLLGSAPNDISLVDHIRITYFHKYTADGDALKLSVKGSQQVTIDGFSNAAIRVFDVTDPNEVVEVAGLIQPGKSNFSVTLAATGSGDRTLIALTSGLMRRAERIAANTPSAWRQPANGADLIIVGPREFFASLDSLKRHRQAQKLAVALVDIEDVYDEFSYGQKSPYALRDFFYYAKTNWKRPPRFALLAGDASYDPKNYLGFGDKDRVPTRLIDTSLMETSSDDWLVDFNEDGVPDIALGRLPASSGGVMSRLVNKVISYDETPPAEMLMLVADANDGYNFEAANSTLRLLVPDNLRVLELNRGRLDPDVARAMLLGAINDGLTVLNYTGHGSVDLLRGGLLTSDDAAALTNQKSLSLFVMMTCLNGYFHDAALDSLAEAMLKAERGGAIGAWASSGLTLPADQVALNQQLYRLMFARSSPLTGPLTLGEAAQRAKAAIADDDVRRTWILLSDPTTTLR